MGAVRAKQTSQERALSRRCPAGRRSVATPPPPAGRSGTPALGLRELVKQSLWMRPSWMMGYRERGNPDTGQGR
jgi:hypothetical protein